MKAFKEPGFILEHTSLVESFLGFVGINTQSDPTSSTNPSTEKQLALQRVLVEKLESVGCIDVCLDQHGYLTATFRGNQLSVPVIGLIAHVDTATDFSGAGVKPIVHERFEGGPIELPAGVTIDPDDSPELKNCKGDDIITSSGDTLLGADDKAGIAEILATLEVLAEDDSIARPTLRIAFTPDEEIGRGALNFDVDSFGAACAYTVDGGWAGEVNFETFSADKADVTFTGVAVHPGWAQGKMVNALRFLGRFLDLLPRDEAPETTSGRRGFSHPTRISGSAAEASVELILRDFETGDLQERGRRITEIVEQIAAEEPRLGVKVEITEQYRNMADALENQVEVRDHLLKAVEDAGLKPEPRAVRGGTDGSGLTAKGLPTPNIFAGGVNFHGPREWVSTRVMALSVCTLLNLVQRWAEAGK